MTVGALRIRRVQDAPEPGDGFRVLVDRLSLETFGNRGEVSITNIAHQKPSQPALSVAAVGGEAALTSLSAHAIESMWKNFKE